MVAAYRRQVPPSDDLNVIMGAFNLAMVYTKLKRNEEALQLCAETRANLRRTQPVDSAAVLDVEWLMVLVLVDLKRGAEAIPLPEFGEIQRTA